MSSLSITLEKTEFEKQFDINQKKQNRAEKKQNCTTLDLHSFEKIFWCKYWDNVVFTKKYKKIIKWQISL